MPLAISAPESPQEAQGVLTTSGSRKAAILLTTLDDQTSAAILRELSEREVHDVVRGIGRLTNITDEERQMVLREYIGRVEDEGSFAPGGREYATSVLVTAFGPEAGRRMAECALQPAKSDGSGIDALRNADPQHLARVVHQEHPQTIALLLSHLGGAQAAELLSELPSTLRLEVAKRMAAMKQISPEVVDRIAKIIGGKLQVAGAATHQSYEGLRAVAEILNRVDASTTEELLKEISNDDATLGEKIRNLMFVFDDFQNVSKESMRALLARVDRKLLTVALKGASPQLKNHFTSLMSGGAVEMLNEDMQALGLVRIKDVQEAQQKVIATARQMESEGLISLTASSADEYIE